MRPGTTRVKPLLLLCFITLHSDAQQKLRPRFPLPPRAKVLVDGAYNDMLPSDPYRDACDRFKTSPQQIRRWFAVDKQISGGERHDGIDEVACGIAGRILVDGKTYRWQLVQADPVGFMETDWPDGKQKMLAQRVGDLSDNPHPHRLSTHVDAAFWDR